MYIVVLVNFAWLIDWLIDWLVDDKLFQAKFADSMSDIEARISNVKSVTEFLISSQHVKEMFGGQGSDL